MTVERNILSEMLMPRWREEIQRQRKRRLIRRLKMGAVLLVIAAIVAATQGWIPANLVCVWNNSYCI
jgi:hypothetical protein